MSKIVFVRATGVVTAVDAVHGDSVMQTAVNAGIAEIIGECGGSMMCATCHVYVDKAFISKLPAMSDIESEMLDSAASERRPESRLSCQIEVSPELDGLVVFTPERQQ